MKSYLEMGLPVVMTRISGIVSYIEKFKAGEVIDSKEALPQAVLRICENPETYFGGVRNFADRFMYERYYAENFRLDSGTGEGE